MRREGRSLRPPIFQNTGCLAAIMGEIGDSGHDSRLDGSAKNATSPANLAAVLNYTPRFEIRADNRRFRPTPEVLPSLQASTFVSELRIRLTSEWGKPLSAINSRYGRSGSRVPARSRPCEDTI